MPACRRAFREWRSAPGRRRASASVVHPRGMPRLLNREGGVLGSPGRELFLRRAASRRTRAGSRRALSLPRMNRCLGRNFVEAMDPLEWLARMADHIADRGITTESASTAISRGAGRGARAARAEPPTEVEKNGSGATTNESGTRRRCPPSWARLIHRVYQADPLVCRRCSGELEDHTATCADGFAVRRMLEGMGLAPREDEPPPVPTPPRGVGARPRWTRRVASSALRSVTLKQRPLLSGRCSMVLTRAAAWAKPACLESQHHEPYDFAACQPSAFRAGRSLATRVRSSTDLARSQWDPGRLAWGIDLPIGSPFRHRARGRRFPATGPRSTGALPRWSEKLWSVATDS